jgi:hypothetical protein
VNTADLILWSALQGASRRMAACSGVRVAILRDGRPEGGLLRMRSKIF